MPMFKVPVKIFVDAEDDAMAIEMAFSVLENGRENAYVDGADLCAYAVRNGSVEETDSIEGDEE